MANDFSGDSNCVALWRFESGALTTDSKGSNTLTDNNTVQEDTSNQKEGSCCADCEADNVEYFSITDGNLDSGFPLKSGDSNKKISICAWLKIESIVSNHFIYTKYSSGNYSIRITLFSNSKIQLRIGYNGGASSEDLYYADPGMVTGRWFHIAATFDDTDKSWKFIIWDDTASSKILDTSGTATNNINVGSADVEIGHGFDGLIDEMVVFKDILSTAEIDQIRGGTYSAGGTTVTLTKVALSFSGNPFYQSETFVTGKETLAFTGGDVTLADAVTLGALSTSFTGGAFIVNETFNFVKQALAFTGKALTASVGGVTLTLTKLALAFTGKTLYLAETCLLEKGSLIFGGRIASFLGEGIRRGLSKVGSSTKME